MNGEPIKKYHVSDFSQPLAVYGKLLSQGVNVEELSERLMFSKSPKWHYEDETRVICPLQLCEKKLGATIVPSEENDVIVDLPNLIQSYSEICLKKIPFDAFDSVVLGYAISNADKITIINKIKDNPLLSNLKLKVESCKA